MQVFVILRLSFAFRMIGIRLSSCFRSASKSLNFSYQNSFLLHLPRKYVTVAEPGNNNPDVAPEFLFERLAGERKGIVIFSLNRPKFRNAISRNLAALMKDAVNSTSKDKEARVVIIRSTTPGAFCAGADLKERSKMKEEDVGPFVSSLRSLVENLYELPVPTIAALDGVALGGGLEMALACDFRIASDTAKLGLVETKLGIIPGAGGTQFLSRLIGPSRAKDLIFSAEVLDGESAAKLGLVSDVVEQNSYGDAAFQRALSKAEKILLNGPIAIRMAKVAINNGFELNLAEGLRLEEGCYAQVIGTKDRLEGLAAFNEKRKAKFTNE